MAEIDIVSALKEKRIKLATEIERLQVSLRRPVIDLGHREATLKLFDPDVVISDLGPPKVSYVLSDIHGDTGRAILDTLRTVTTPLSTAKICTSH